MYYIHSASTLSHQNTFAKKGFSENLIPITRSSTLIQPNYKEFIDPMQLRRMSPIIRMSICCSLDCIRNADVNEPDAIIVGTGLGCLNDTEVFLKALVSSGENLISPTPFIQSTHNTIAGQLSLILKNHHYNMTHTQNTLSFEHALQDGLLCLEEGMEHVLVGAADEHIAFLDGISNKIIDKEICLASGASFFVISSKKNEQTKFKILASTSFFGNSNKSSIMEQFFSENNIGKDSIDLILFSTFDTNTKNELNLFFRDNLLCDFQNYCGVYFSNSAFALHLAMDILENGSVKFDFMENKKQNINRILIYNSLNPKNLGLTLIETLEA